MIIEPPILTRDRLRKLGIVATVTLAHLGAFAVMGRPSGPQLPPATVQPAINVELVRPVPPPPPPPPPNPAVVAGGGAPAAPSRVHVTKAPTKPAELPAPVVPAPKPDPILVGAAPISSGQPGMGQGGQGTGTGSGTGEGDGPGSGGRGPMILRGASQAEILPMAPPAARAARQTGRAAVSCVIRADSRVEDCRVVEELPPGMGFGEAAVRVATTYFRFRPPTDGAGRVIDGARVTIGVQFGRQGR